MRAPRSGRSSPIRPPTCSRPGSGLECSSPTRRSPSGPGSSSSGSATPDPGLRGPAPLASFLIAPGGLPSGTATGHASCSGLAVRGPEGNPLARVAALGRRLDRGAAAPAGAGGPPGDPGLLAATRATGGDLADAVL